MSGRLSNLNTRLAKVEQQVADRAWRERLAHCNCCPQDPECLGIPLVLSSAKEFEEMIVPCSAHGFRDLGKLIVLPLVKAGGTLAEKSVGLDEVVAEYNRRRSEFLTSHPGA